MADRAASPYTDLSGGQRQLVLVQSQIARLAAHGLGIVPSTHDPDHAVAVGSRVALLHAGRIRAVGAPAEVLTAAALSDVYGVDVQVETLASGRRVCVPALGRRPDQPGFALNG